MSGVGFRVSGKIELYSGSHQKLYCLFVGSPGERLLLTLSPLMLCYGLLCFLPIFPTPHTPHPIPCLPSTRACHPFRSRGWVTKPLLRLLDYLPVFSPAATHFSTSGITSLISFQPRISVTFFSRFLYVLKNSEISSNRCSATSFRDFT